MRWERGRPPPAAARPDQVLMSDARFAKPARRMPNGDPDFNIKELPKLERFFARLAPAITRFAKKHSLRIERYYHQLPSWEFCFDHPKGGCAYIEIRRESDDEFSVISAWWIDKAGTRSSR